VSVVGVVVVVVGVVVGGVSVWCSSVAAGSIGFV
jgi:hypothetical protein